MRSSSTPRGETPRRGPFPTGLAVVLAPLLAAVLAAGCGGGGGGGGSDGSDPSPPPAPWQGVAVKRLAVSGLTTPRLAAELDGAGRAHMAFFEDSGNPVRPYRISYLAWDPAAALAPEETAVEEVVQLDNCADVSLALGAGGAPLVLYQGGTPTACGANDRSGDAMVSLRGAGAWAEHTAAIGFVERNPVLPDGLAGSNLAVATDSLGGIHAVYQFFYEGCDSMNFRYPDLRYVRMDPSHPEGATEETVEGNVYGSTNIQSSVGSPAALVVEASGEPVAFYAAELPGGAQGLRAARRVGGSWQAEWVEQGCVIGAVSAARSAADGTVGVAYAVTRYLDGRDSDHLLRYAARGPSGWVSATVDEATRCGEACSLAFDPEGRPAVAYREEETHSGYALKNLRLARFDGASWSSETVASAGDVGLYNRLRIDAEGRLDVFTYSATDQTIYRYRKAP